MHRFQGRLVCIILILLMSALASASVTVVVTAPNGGEIITQRDGNYSIDFNVLSTATNTVYAGIKYNTSTDWNSGIVIVDGLALASVCDDANFADSTHCSWGWNTTGVNGTYYLLIQVVTISPVDSNSDSSDGTFIVDNNSPIIYNYSPASSWSNSHIITANLSDAETDINANSIRLNVEGTDYNILHQRLSYAGGVLTFDGNTLFAPQQDINITLDVNDLAGNPASQAVWSYNLDQNRPYASVVDAEISDSWVSSDTFSINCFDPGSGCANTKWYYFDPQGGTNCSTSKSTYINDTNASTITVSSDENRFVCLWVEDLAGNNDTDSSLKSLKVDATAPQTSHDAATGWTTDLNVQLTADDFGLFDINVSGIARVDYNINSNTYTATNDSNSQPFSFNIDFNEGANSLSFSAVDRAGNVESAITIDVNVDYTPPINPDINIADGNWTNDDEPDLNLFASDGESSIKEMKFSCNNANWTAWIAYATSYSDFNFLDSSYGCNPNYGDKNIFVVFRDMANNEGASVYDSTYFDSNPPTTSRTPSYSFGWQNTALNIDLNCSDAESGCQSIEYFINGNPFSQAGNGVTLTFNTDGNHSLVYYSLDNANNRDNNNLVYIPIDQSAPITTITPGATWQNADFNATLTCNDGGLSGCLGISYRLDTDASNNVPPAFGSWNPYLSPLPISSDGNYAIEFYSTDNVSNTEATSTSYLLLDKTAPTAPTLSLPSAQNTNTVNLSWSGASDSTSGINNYNVWRRNSNSSIWTLITTTNLNGYSEILAMDTNYQYCYKVQAFDNAGNDANSSEACIWLDSVAPIITNFNATVNNDSVTLNYSASDTNGSGIQVYYVKKGTDSWINNGTNTSYVFNSLANGIYTFYVRAVDNANNSTDANTAATVNYSPPPPPPPTPSGGNSPGGGSIYLPIGSGSNQEDEGTTQPEEGAGEQPEGVDIDLCGGISCDDSNPCTIDRCSAGSCTYSNVLNGTPCNETGQCLDGECIQPQEEQQEPQTGPTGFLGMGESLALGIGILALLIGGYSYLRKRRMSRGTPKAPETKFYYDSG